MGKVNYKNQYALLVYLVLRDYSDARHLIEQPEILAHLSTDYGVETQRRSISRALDVLEALDFDLIRTAKGSLSAGGFSTKGNSNTSSTRFIPHLRFRLMMPTRFSLASPKPFPLRRENAWPGLRKRKNGANWPTPTSSMRSERLLGRLSGIPSSNSPTTPMTKRENCRR
jgi:hypothetical protein